MLDLVVYLAPENRGWVIERICAEIVRRAPERARVVVDGPVPRARAYLYSHFALLPRHPRVPGARHGVLFYHPWSQEKDLDPAKYAASEIGLLPELRRLDRVITLARCSLDYLASIGVPRDRLTHTLVGTDSSLFPAHDRSGDGAIGFVSAFYRRKNPDRIVDLVQRIPHRDFVLMGRGWEKYERFPELAAAPHLDYVETDYARYPEHYARMDVLCSPSLLEGACLPILEAMMCNVVPVASRTGHADDLIRHGENGFLFDPNAPTEAVAELLEKAFTVGADVRETVRHLTWARFARSIWETLGLD